MLFLFAGWFMCTGWIYIVWRVNRSLKKINIGVRNLTLGYFKGGAELVKYLPTVIPGAVRKSEENNMALDVDSILGRIGQFGPFQIRILAMFLFIFFPITFQTLIMVFVAYEPPWMCAQQSEPCVEFNRSSGRSAVYSTATKPSELYEGRCILERSDWKFANYNLYDGPHNTIVDEVKH